MGLLRLQCGRPWPVQQLESIVDSKQCALGGRLHGIDYRKITSESMMWVVCHMPSFLQLSLKDSNRLMEHVASCMKRLETFRTKCPPAKLQVLRTVPKFQGDGAHGGRSTSSWYMATISAWVKWSGLMLGCSVADKTQEFWCVEMGAT